MTQFSISIQKWSAWMPGIVTTEQWQQWAQGRLEPSVDRCDPPTASIPPMLRRRLGTLGNIVAAVALPLVESFDQVPCVFSSCHGDLQRTVQLLQSLADHQPMSPTQFSLSVHNAIGGVLSIARKDTSPITALVAGDGGIACALFEALHYLDSNYEQALCVLYDRPVHDLYKEPRLLPQQPYAVAFLLTKKRQTQSQYLTYSLAPKTSNAGNILHEPQAVSLLRFLLHEEQEELILPQLKNTISWQKIIDS